MTAIIFIIITLIVIFIIVYRNNNGENVYKYITDQTAMLYDKYAPYSFKSIREKVKELGQEYTTRQYVIQIVIFAIGSFLVTYLYFYNVLLSLLYSILSIVVILLAQENKNN